MLSLKFLNFSVHFYECLSEFRMLRIMAKCTSTVDWEHYPVGGGGGGGGGYFRQMSLWVPYGRGSHFFLCY